MKLVKNGLVAILGGLLGVLIIVGYALYNFESTHQDTSYPGIHVGSHSVAGMTPDEIDAFVKNESKPLADTILTIEYEDQIATFSGSELSLAYNGNLASTQAISYGRSGNLGTDIRFKLHSFVYKLFPERFVQPIVSVPLLVSYRNEPIDTTLENLAAHIDIEPIEPLFDINAETKRVNAFRLGENGQALDAIAAKQMVETELTSNFGKEITLTLPVHTVEPKADASDIEEMGIVELLSTGESFYTGSIPGRVHNILLATSRTSGVIIPPGEIFSFNEAVGDISAATGYKSAYIIKNGRTVLGDGGGVCQVSTTLFRAALNAGLDIVERNPHSYRVTYYELGGFKPGYDATVYYPTVDLKFRNNTAHHILITAIPNEEEQKLVFEIYGKSDGREVQIVDAALSNQVPPPPPLFQDDPTLPVGIQKQVDWAAYGANASFQYKVTRGKELLTKKAFISNFRPWQAVYLVGTKTD